MKFNSIAIFLVMVMVLLPSISAYEFDNVKSYNAETREVTIINGLGLGAEIGKAKLNTPLNVRVGAGYQKVAEFDLWAYQDYNDALKQFSFKDMKKKGKINRNYDLKFLSYENVSVDDYENQITGTIMNGTNLTNVYSNVKVGSHIEIREKWTKITPADLKKNDKLTIGVFTDVQVGDYVDWVPTIYGVEVEEWATWSQSLNVGLISYYKLDETSGTIAIDSVRGFNGTISNGITINQTGKINRGIKGDNTANAKITVPHNALLNGGAELTLNVWWNGTTIGLEDLFLKGTGSSTTRNYWLRIIDGKVSFQFYTGGYLEYTTTNVVLTDNTWQMITATYNDAGNNVSIFVDGVLKQSWTATKSLTTNTLPLELCGDYNGYTCNFNIDEMGIWNRTLTPTEITQLYNNGDGMTYTNVFITSLNITINTASQNFTEVESRQFNFSVTDAIKVSNVSLYINGVLNQTNTSGINNTNYLFNVTLADGTYTILGNAVNNQSFSANSSSITIIVESTHPVITANLSNDTLYVLGGNMTLNYNITHDPNLTGVSAWYSYNGTNRTLNVSQSQINFTTEPNQYNLTLYANDSFGNDATPVNLNFTLDAVAPQTILNYPTALINYGAINQTLQLNFTATDSNLDKVWYNYNGTNVTIAGATSGVANISNITLSSKKNVTIYANDTAGNVNATTFSWDYLIFQNSQNYTTPAYETQLVTFSINLTYNTSSSLSALLNYNGINYTAINSGSGDNAIFTTNAFNIPLINGNVNKTFYWILNYNNSLILTEQINQTINPIVISQCNGTYTVPTLNFTFYDELNQTIINATATPTSFLFNIKYWLGDGSVYKNYSFQNLTSLLNSYQFCISQNVTYKADADMQYYTSLHAERTYYFRNTSLTNTTQYFNLYNLLTTEATKFQINIKEGTNVLANVLVNVQKYFVGINQWKTVLIGLTDDKGAFTANIDLDQKYNLSVTKDGTSYGSFEKSSICLASPCTIDIYLQDIVLNPYDPYYEYFAQNVDYNLTANDTTQVITLDFIDKTGTATYWRLWVYKTYYQNDSIFTICDEKTYSPAGSLTCNYTGNSGDLNAKVYISRSPEKLVTFLNWVNSLDYKTFGASAILASIILILVLFFTGIRNPVNALLLMPLALVILKFLQFMPFSWGWILGLTILDLWLISKLKT